tara:strand:- start:97 stop:387 length:291 start_codon:yes stop_codon:yes gene_type:complete
MTVTVSPVLPAIFAIPTALSELTTLVVVHLLAVQQSESTQVFVAQEPAMPPLTSNPGLHDEYDPPVPSTLSQVGLGSQQSDATQAAFAHVVNVFVK